MESSHYNRKLVIVGNGGSSLLNKNGDFIDSCDIVIRVKSFILDGYEQYVGSKTDIWSTKWFSYLESTYREKINFKFTKLWIPILDPNKKYNSKINTINEFIFKNNFRSRCNEINTHNNLISSIGSDNVKLLNTSELEEILNELKIKEDLIHTKSGINVFHPTTYLLSIFLALKRYANYKTYITGFDSFKKGYYWDLNETKKFKKTWPHHYDREELFIKKLIYSNKIINLN